MKRRIPVECRLAFALAIFAAVPFLGGCDQTARSQQVFDSSTNQIQSADAASDATQQSDSMDQGLVNATGTVISTPSTAAPDTSTNPQINEVVKLVQAGIGDSILMAYVTNSPSPFNLSSGDVVYLNDLGVPQTVVSAMLQRDQNLSSAGAQAQQVYPNPAPGQLADANPTAMVEVPPSAGQPPAPVGQTPAPDQNAAAPAPPVSDATAIAAAEAAQPPTPSPDVLEDADEATNSAYSYFYDSLSPYGNWVNIDGYGPCWQPTVVIANPGWLPYCNSGHWVYTDCGWCWVSDYSWGWAPFHYGRWFRNARFGWCWAPDTVWAPAWVSWRHNATYCGWAPLPPTACYRPGFGFTYLGQSIGINFTFGLTPASFTFVPLNQFRARTLSDFRVSSLEANRIFPNTTLNNQLIRGPNNTLINRGVPVERVAAATQTEIRPVHIRLNLDSPSAPKFGRDGYSLSLYRPHLPLPRSTSKPTLAGEGVQRDPNFDLETHLAEAQQRQSLNPGNSYAPERRPIVSNPNTTVPRNNTRTEIPGNNNGASQPEWRSTPGRAYNGTQWPTYQRGYTSQPQQTQPAQDNRRIYVPQGEAPRVSGSQWQQRNWPQQPNMYGQRQEQPRQEVVPRNYDAPRNYEPPRNYEAPHNYESHSASPAQSAPSVQNNNQSSGNANNTGNASGGGAAGGGGGGGRGH